MNRIAVIGIIVEEPQEVEKLNQLLHEYGSYIIGRMGIPYRERKIHVISIAMDAPQDTIKCPDRQDRKTGRNLGKSSLLGIGDMHEQRHTE